MACWRAQVGAAVSDRLDERVGRCDRSLNGWVIGVALVKFGKSGLGVP
jgi:hypothetical protein